MAGSSIRISDLSPYLSGKWTVYGRLTRWDGIRHYCNARGEGDILTFVLSDSTGMIECVCFGGVALKLSETLQSQKVYVVRDARIEARKANYATTECPFQIQLRATTQIEAAPEDYALDGPAEATVEWLDFEDLAAATAGALPLNVLGILVMHEANGTVSSRSSEATFLRGAIILQNDKCEQITVTLWNEQAKAAAQLQEKTPVLALNLHGELHPDGSLSLSSLPSSSLQSAEDYDEGRQLQEAYLKTDGKTPSKSLTTVFSPGMMQQLALKLVNTISLAVMRRQTTDYFRVIAMVTQIPYPPNFYLRCPILKCNAKVFKQDGGMQCSKCDTKTSNPTIGLHLVLDIQDYSGSAMVSVFNETAAQYLGIPLNTAKEYYEEDAARFNAVTNSRRFVYLEFRVAVAENRQKTFIGKCFGIRPLSETAFLGNLTEMQTGNAVGLVLKTSASL